MSTGDAPARVAVRDDSAGTLFVEAGAGSGKTTSLVERFLALVAAGIPADRIAAITFTEAGLPPPLEVLAEISSQLAFEERWEAFVDELLDDEAVEVPFRRLLASTAALIAAVSGGKDIVDDTCAKRAAAEMTRDEVSALPAPDCEPQRVVVDIDVVPGPFIEAVGERLLRVVTDELLKTGWRSPAPASSSTAGSRHGEHRVHRRLPNHHHRAMPADVQTPLPPTPARRGRIREHLHH
jgi:hypothetical protein